MWDWARDYGNANIALKKRNHAELTVPQKQEILDFDKVGEEEISMYLR
jgi:hypothetical protein